MASFRQCWLSRAGKPESWAEVGHNIPRISFFLGIAIYMYYKEHSPSHFHAEYANFEVTIEIESGVVSGRFPRRALNLVLE